MVLLTVIITIFMLGLLVLVHELGHFLVARRVGILCHEFSIGFGPLLYAWQPGETRFTLRAIPLGGYVLMAGERVEDESLRAPKGRNFDEQSILARAAVALAGSFTNFLLAILIFFAIYSVIGIPWPTLTLEAVEPGSPAEVAGLRPGDTVRAVQGEPLEDWMDLVHRLRANTGESLDITLARDDQLVTVSVSPAIDPTTGVGMIGVASRQETRRLPVWTAAVESVLWTGQVLALLGQTILRMVTGREGTDQLIGVVGMGAEVGRATQMGLIYLLSLAASISASLGFINLLPIPALDGSRIVYLTIEAILGRRLDPAKEGLINLIGFAFLIALALYVTFQDILRLTG